MTAILGAAAAAACGGAPAEPTREPAPASARTAAQPITFKVATWNIRSGMGIRGFTSSGWSSDTLNCTDASKPMNAWGIGLPQGELARMRDDPSIVAVALQEAWNCGNPSNVNSVLGFRDMSREQNGTAVAARYGFAAPPTYTRITGQDWLVGGDVCLNAACTTSIPMFSTHWTPPNNEFGGTAQRTIELLAGHRKPHVLLGDLNVYRIDAWNPDVPCTGPDHPGRVEAIQRMEAAGYLDAWKVTQVSEGWTGMASRAGCGLPSGNLFKRIDYVYAMDLRPVSAMRLARAAPGADSPSDHVALVVELATASGTSITSER